ncbi:hypothetical protein [Paraglaciecola polaris]|uniref:Rap1a immunity protein domain-containing protein n=1 Tax=Paraglaciecola polaris LMG 21857 TaxID=1129793 RepID=K6ZW21_9ALTE|nr:hypothetical protein [Paraglaciecola polaris]GAC32983.1 hypothetical protein GPLA_2078 [Paraglaciecola polaris LMG 21857]
MNIMNFGAAKIGYICLALLGMLTFSANVAAQPQPIWQSCQSLKTLSLNQATISDDEQALCYQFINGFLQGAVLTDSQIMRGLEEGDALSTFAQRAIRTRVGNSRATDADTYLAHFCLPTADIDYATVVSVAKALPKERSGQAGLANEVYVAVKKAFPCT